MRTDSGWLGIVSYESDGWPGSGPASSIGETILATFTLAALRGATVDLGDGLRLSNFRNDGSTINPNLILIDTIDGADLGLRVRVADGAATTAGATQNVGIDFELNAPAFILEGASMSLDDFGFATPNAGGLATATLSQQRAAPQHRDRPRHQ